MRRFEWSAIFGDSEAKKRRGSFNNVELTAQQQAILAQYLQSRPPEYLVPRRMRKRALRATLAQRLPQDHHAANTLPSQSSAHNPAAALRSRTLPAQHDNTSQPRRRKSLFDMPPDRQQVGPALRLFVQAPEQQPPPPVRSPYCSPVTPRTPRTPPRSPRSPTITRPQEPAQQPRRRKSAFDANEQKGLPRSNSLYTNVNGRVVKPIQEIRRRSLVAQMQLVDVVVPEEEIPDEASKATQQLLREQYMRLMTTKEMLKRELRRGRITGSEYRQKVQLASQEFQAAYAQAYEAIADSIAETKRLVMKRASSDTKIMNRRSTHIRREEATRAQELAAKPWHQMVFADVLTTRDTI